MDEVTARMPGAPEGLTVLAWHQTAGKGRAGRHWRAEPKDALLFSTLLRPEANLSRFQLFPIVAGLAICDAVAEMTGIACHIKWPNDVLIEDRKLAGVLINSRLRGTTVESAILGVGINVRRAPKGIRDTAIALEELSRTSVDPMELLDLLLRHLSAVYGQVLTGQPGQLVDRWRDRAATLGDQVTVVDQGREITGILKGISDSGALALQQPDGRIVHVVAGELIRGPAKVLEGG